ncbi:neutral zinc metallopeptidase [Nonomuraea sp. NPDC050556]|uniref:neutral zinc metallopeptidase n=1 Tax=Nonomuraea sp. NPDC050556 TaxID=3364369 RepID=UPI0037A24768
MFTPLLVAALALTPTPLYDSGRMKTSSCHERVLTQGGIPHAKEYLAAVTSCLDAAWSAHLHPFSKPSVRYYEEPADRVCGVPWPSGASAFYCTTSRTLHFPLEGAWIEDRTDLYPFKVAAHEYGHHVQQVTGLRRAYERLARATPRRAAEYNRRYELQADCLAGVFLGSVWDSLDRSPKDWADLVDATIASGDWGEDYRSHGRGTTRAYWLKRGYAAVSPGACDTWKAPASKVS